MQAPHDVVKAVRQQVHQCALDIVEGRVSPSEGAALLERLRNELVELGELLEGFVGLEAEHEIAGCDRAAGKLQRSEEIEREIVSRAETPRRTVEA